MVEQPSRTLAIKRFLTALTYADLAELYNFDMEVQVNVAQDGGERVDKTFKGRTYNVWTDGIEEWKPIRIPRNASTLPEYEDSPMNFDLTKHAEGIGMTGWDWKNGVSRWVAFDFDAIAGHSDRHMRKSSDEELKQIEELVRNVPWVTLRYSTSGKGLHLYVFLDSVPTENHNEHAALARSILGQLSAIVGYDFSSKVDICGGNMWVWHRKMANTNGLLLIKAGEIFTDVPANWRDHIEVVKGNRRRTLPQEITNNNEEDAFDKVTGREVKVDLDTEHRALLEWLSVNGSTWWWDNDRNMLVTHTFFLQQAHEEMGLRGVFKTNSTGTERGTDHNCFAYPNRKGAWSVRRFTPGVAEDPSWSQDGAGWTKCYLNRDPDLATTARSLGGSELPKGGYHFTSAKEASDVAVKLGAEMALPMKMMERPTIIEQHRDGRRLIVKVEREVLKDSPREMDGWIPDKKHFTRVFDVKYASPPEPEVGDFDDYLRHIVTTEGKDSGWVVNAGQCWLDEPLQHVKPVLKANGHKTGDIDVILGNAILKNWKIVNLPFQVEYPGGREWNRTAAQFRFKPSLDAEEHDCPTWIMLLDHLGEMLNDDIREHPWCIQNSILTGGDYLKCWIASLFQFPLEPLPYLFFHSEKQATGKSTFVEAISLLVSQGAVVLAKNALLSQGGFNGELHSSILCSVEEVDLTSGVGKQLASDRIKDWVTAKTFQIHPKGGTPYQIPNSTHWVQTANRAGNCPIFPGDTRITMIEVGAIEEGKMIPRRTLLELLTREAPDFLGSVLKLDIPVSNDRLNIPIIGSSGKSQVQMTNMTPVEQFIQENCSLVDGEYIKFSEFCDKFIAWAKAFGDNLDYTAHKIKRELPISVVFGTINNNQRYLGNISFSPGPGTRPRIKLKETCLYAGDRRLNVES